METSAQSEWDQLQCWKTQRQWMSERHSAWHKNLFFVECHLVLDMLYFWVDLYLKLHTVLHIYKCQGSPFLATGQCSWTALSLVTCRNHCWVRLSLIEADNPSFSQFIPTLKACCSPTEGVYSSGKVMSVHSLYLLQFLIVTVSCASGFELTEFKINVVTAVWWQVIYFTGSVPAAQNHTSIEELDLAPYQSFIMDRSALILNYLHKTSAPLLPSQSTVVSVCRMDWARQFLGNWAEFSVPFLLTDMACSL